MKVIVDTCVWSLALRRADDNSPNPKVTQLQELILERRVELMGAIRQELLSGIANFEQFEKLKNYLRAFPDLELNNEDYETAALFYNKCRAHGIQGSNTDFLICAVSSNRSMAIFTSDNDFTLYSKVLPIKFF